MTINIDSELHNADWIRIQAARHKWEQPVVLSYKDNTTPAIIEQPQLESPPTQTGDDNA